MSREWFMLARNSTRSATRHPLADPLEHQAWEGLLWVLPLLSWLAGSGQRPSTPQAKRQPLSRRLANAQTRSPFLTR